MFDHLALCSTLPSIHRMDVETFHVPIPYHTLYYNLECPKQHQKICIMTCKFESLQSHIEIVDHLLAYATPYTLYQNELIHDTNQTQYY